MNPAIETALWTEAISILGFVLFAALIGGAAWWYKVKRALGAAPEKKDAPDHWSAGRARVLWGPVPNRMGGIAELAESADYALDETGEVHRGSGVWHVVTDAGERLVLPLQETVVCFLSSEPAKKPVLPLSASELAGLAGKLSAKGPDVYKCPVCSSCYTKQIEAYICSMRDKPSKKIGEKTIFDPFKEENYQIPVFEPMFGSEGDCQKCGYPTGLHSGPSPRGSCSLLFPAIDGHGDVFHFEPHRKTRTGS